METQYLYTRDFQVTCCLLYGGVSMGTQYLYTCV